MKPVLILDLYGTLLSIPRNEHYMSPLVVNRLLTTMKPVIAPYVEKSLLWQKSQVVPFEDTYEFLESVKTIHTLVCVSNLSQHFIECFNQWKLNRYIHETLFSCEIRSIKPEPLIYLKVLEKFPESKIYMIGDSYHHDYIVPRRLGIASYWLNREGKRQKIDPNHVISNLMEFHTKIQK